MSTRVIATINAAIFVLLLASTSSADEIKVVSSVGMKAVVEALAPQFEKATKHKVTTTFDLSANVKKNIESGAPFDVEDTFWSHRGETCTFDTMLAEFGLATEPLGRLARIVRGADTARLDLAPEAPGLLAASLGLSRMYADDIEQLAAGMTLYDAFYRWCRDATDETHNWPAKPAKAPAKPRHSVPA